MKLTTGYKKPIASSGTDALELSSNNSYLLLAGGGHKALSELVSPADLTTELSNYVTIGSNLTITGIKTFSLAINADITGNADTVDGEHAVAFAHIGAHNNLIVNNEFTFVSSGFNGDIWLNYRTAGGTNGDITDYIFGNGKGGQLYSLNTIATNASTAYSWGNHANVGYLLRSDIGSLSVNYATNAGNAVTLNGHTSDDFVLKTTHDVYESVIVESLNDLDNRKIEISDLPTSLPANGGHAATATNVDWSGVTNKPSSFPANGGNADTINGYSSSDFVLNTNYGEFKSVVATALTDLDNRKIEASDIPTSLPANGGNADTSDYAGYLRGRDVNGFYFGKETSSNIIAEWNTKSDNRWYLKAASINQCRVEYADKASEADNVSWSNIENKPAATIGDASLVIQVNGTQITPEGGNFTANKSGVPSIYNISIGNGRLILKNGNDIISDNFTANKGDDTTIDLNSAFTNKIDFNLLGDKVDRIDTSIAELNAKMQSTISSDYSSEGGDEGKGVDEGNAEESEYTPLSRQVGTISLKFRNFSSEVFVLPVYDVWVHYITDVVGPVGYVNYCYEISLVVGPYTGNSLDEITLGTYNFFIRGANRNNNVCGFDVRGNGTINSAVVTFIGDYMHLKCYLLLHGEIDGEEYNIGDAIMSAIKNEQFNAYFCLRQTP